MYGISGRPCKPLPFLKHVPAARPSPCRLGEKWAPEAAPLVLGNTGGQVHVAAETKRVEEALVVLGQLLLHALDNLECSGGMAR